MSTVDDRESGEDRKKGEGERDALMKINSGAQREVLSGLEVMMSGELYKVVHLRERF